METTSATNSPTVTTTTSTTMTTVGTTGAAATTLQQPSTTTMTITPSTSSAVATATISALIGSSGSSICTGSFSGSIPAAATAASLSTITHITQQQQQAASSAVAAATVLPQLLGQAASISVPATVSVIEIVKTDDANLSLASGLSEGQRSLSAAPSASSSPILSPQGKFFGRNANGTMIATSRPSNEAEIQLYRVLQRASLLAYYDTLLEMGGDDVQQLYDAGEEEFLEIMALVGMASKPLHVRRLQKSLHEWANNPSIFQGPLPISTSGLCETPTKSAIVFNPDTSFAMSRNKFPAFNPGASFHPTPLINTAQSTSSPSSSSSANLLSQICAPAITVPVIQPHTPHTANAPPVAVTPIILGTNPLTTTTLPSTQQPSGSTAHQVTSSSPQLTPVLTEMQVNRITLGAEKIARQLPQREPRAQTSKKRTSRELEQVIAMSENDPRRMEEIRKYSAIYGRFDCKRRPEKPLTLHEVCVNEAAAQLCRLVPALLTRRDELFPLARQIVKDAGFGHSASIARYGGLLTQLQAQNVQRSAVPADCESSDAPAVGKRQRLSSTDNSATAPMDGNRETMEDSRYNLFAMYQKFAKPPFDLSEIAKFSLSKTDFEDNDNESRFSFSNSSSPPMPANGTENDRDEAQSSAGSTISTSHNRSCTKSGNHAESSELISMASSPLGEIQIISAAGGNIIAVANPALALSPTLNEALSLKRDGTTPDL